MIVFSVLSTWFLMDKMEINPDAYEVVYTLGSRPLYYAFNKETDDEFIADLNRTLQEMKKPNAGGTSIVEQIINSYL
jgi:ABC-type amino acid transport substrate-binding protein